jgi:hypothetical protein
VIEADGQEGLTQEALSGHVIQVLLGEHFKGGAATVSLVADRINRSHASFAELPLEFEGPGGMRSEERFGGESFAEQRFDLRRRYRHSTLTSRDQESRLAQQGVRGKNPLVI